MKIRITYSVILATILMFIAFQAFSVVAEPVAQSLDCSLSSDVSQAECEALVDLYNATGGDNWSNNQNWLVISQSIDICNWNGVVCDAGAVNGLSLNSNNLSGTLPSTFWNLTNLTFAEFDRNNLRGDISGIGNLNEIVYFSALANQLTGTLPSDIGSLPNLETLNLIANQISGEIPSEIGNASKLEVLDLSNNNLTGTIPSEIGNLEALRSLKLDINNLNGPIPSELSNLSDLILLYLSENQLSGSIPTELGDLINLQRLLLSRNSLTGTIPTELGNLDNLTYMYLHENKLDGAIPTELGDLSSIQELLLTSNKLTGGIPAELGSATTLKRLHLANNQLTGTLPAELENLSSLDYLYVYNNNLAGEVPSEFVNLSSLFYFWFFGNDICVPNDPSVTSWLEKLNGGNGAQGTGLICGTPGGSISGTVTNGASLPLSDIEVHLIRIISSYQSVTESITNTNSTGQYQFDNLGEEISYTLKFVDPTNTLDSEYYDNVAEAQFASAVTVIFGNTTANIDAVLGTPAQQFFDLTVLHAGEGVGAVTSSPSGINCDINEPSYLRDCSEFFAEGTVITLTAAPSQNGHQFAGWSAPCSGTSTCSITITQPVTITSTFNPPIPTYLVSTYGAAPAGRYIDIQSDPAAEFTCSLFNCEASFQAGTVATFTYNVPDGQIFEEWTGDCADTVGTVCVLTIDSNKSLGANTRLAADFNLSVGKPVEGISISSEPAGIDCGATCEAIFTENSVVTLTYELEDGLVFDGWQGDCTGLDACAVTMNSNKAVSATVSEQVKQRLDITLAGSGVSIVSSPEGIDCGEICSANFDENETVTLTHQLQVGYQFDGWSGDCSGVQTCVISMDSAKQVTATASAEIFELTGKIVDIDGNPLSDVTLTATEILTDKSQLRTIWQTATISTVTDIDGNYTFELPSGNFIIALSKEEVTFDPSSFTVAISGQDVRLENVIVDGAPTAQPNVYPLYLPLVTR